MMLEQLAQMWGFLDRALPTGVMGSPQHMQMREFILLSN
jgi:hypothetical protein